MRQDIQPAEFEQRIAAKYPIRIVDVRTPREFASGHVPGAINCPFDKINGQLPGIELHEEVVIVCHSGMRSSIACKQLSETYEHLFNLVGGTSGWRSAGHAVTADPKVDRRLDRQTHLVAGLLMFTTLLLFRCADPNWIYLALLPVLGLFIDALTGVCPMTVVLRQMPWNASLKQTS